MPVELTELTENLDLGSESGGNYTQIETDGTLVSKGDATEFEDMRFPVIGQRLTVSAGRIDINYDTLCVDYQINARYPNEFIGVTAQLEHARKTDSDIFPHLHWNQTSANMPNILVIYTWYNNNEQVPTFASDGVKVALTSSNNVFTWTTGTLAQITNIPLPLNLGVGKGISSFFDVQIFRDSNNTSGLFSGADNYSGAWSLKEYDIHIEKDMKGSRQEYVK